MIEEIENEGLDFAVHTTLVRKSLPLLNLWASRLDNEENKLFDVYLSRIDPRDPSTRKVVLEKRELEKILGVKKIPIEDMRRRLRALCEPLDFYDIVDGKYVAVCLPLFEYTSSVAPNPETGVTEVTMICSQTAMKYIFNIENIKYIKYALENVVQLKSKYSYYMFLYLEAERTRKLWAAQHAKKKYFGGPVFEIKFPELRRRLGIKQDKVPREVLQKYTDFKFFHANVLKFTKQDLEEKLGCKFNYELIKEGRVVTKIRFELSEDFSACLYKGIWAKPSCTSATTTEQKQAEKTKMVNKVKKTLPPPSNPNPSLEEAAKTKNGKSVETKKWNRKGRPIAAFEYKKLDFDIRKLINRRENENFDDCDEFKEKLRV